MLQLIPLFIVFPLRNVSRLMGLLILSCMGLVFSLNAHSLDREGAEQKHIHLVSTKSLLVSVHPMALLIKTAWPKLEVSSLVGANQSPHDFVLKPSDMTRIRAADSVIWMGAEFEPFLNNAVRNMPQIDVSKIIEKDSHDLHLEEDDHQGHSHEDHHAHDPHLWLAPTKIKQIIQLVQQALNLPEPSAFLISYGIWLKQAQKQLSPLKQVGFVSFHGAFDEWVDAFELTQLAVVTSNPEKPVGTRHIVEVRKTLASGRASCLFVEPQFQSRIVTKLHKGLDINVINIDPMASNYEIESAGFLNFYRELLSNFTQCLKS